MMSQVHEDAMFNPVYITKWAMATAASWWVTVPVTVQALAVLMTLDYFAGLLKAKRKGNLCWNVARDGLIDKSMVAILMLSAYWLSRAMNLPINIGSGLSCAFCVNEFASTMRNCKEAGVYVPRAVLEFLSRAKDYNKPKRKRNSR